MEFAMSSFDTSAIVEQQGQVHVRGVPFALGTEVEVSIRPKRAPGEQFAAAWLRLCSELRDRPNIKALSDSEITEEIQHHRSGR
jgi:hypothetical protein